MDIQNDHQNRIYFLGPFADGNAANKNSEPHIVRSNGNWATMPRPVLPDGALLCLHRAQTVNSQALSVDRKPWFILSRHYRSCMERSLVSGSILIHSS